MPIDGATIGQRGAQRPGHHAPVLLRIPDLTHGEKPHRAESIAGATVVGREESGDTGRSAAASSETRRAAAFSLGDWWESGGAKIVIWTLLAIAALCFAAWLQIHTNPTIDAPDTAPPAAAQSAPLLKETASWDPPPVPESATQDPQPPERRPVITGLRPYTEDGNASDSESGTRQASLPDAAQMNSLSNRMERAMQQSNEQPGTVPTVQR